MDRNSPASDSRLLHPPYPRCSKQGKISPYPASGPLGTRTQPGHRMDAASRWEASSSGWYAEKHMGGDTGENGIDKTLIGDVMLQHRQEAANETPQVIFYPWPRPRKLSGPRPDHPTGEKAEPTLIHRGGYLSGHRFLRGNCHPYSCLPSSIVASSASPPISIAATVQPKLEHCPCRHP